MSKYRPLPVQDLARRALSFLLLLALLVPMVALAADEPDSTSAPAGRAAPVPLVVNNRHVVDFRASFLGYSPEQRAEATQERIREAIRSRPRNQENFSVETVKGGKMGWLFQIDGKTVFGLVHGDVDPFSDDTLDQLVARTRANLEDAVGAAIEQRTTSRLIRSIVVSVVATILLILSLRGLSWLSKRVHAWMQGRMLARAKPIGETHVSMYRQVGGIIRGVLRVVQVLLGLVLLDVWVTFVLKQFPYTYPWGDQIDDFLLNAVSTIGLSMLRAVPKLVILVIILLIGRFVVKWVKLFFGAVKEGRIDPPGVDRDTAIPVQRLVILFVWVVVIAIAYPFIPGSQGVAFKGLSVLLGLMISLGSSNVVSQAASGYMIMFSKALRTNDYVRIGEYEGTVTSVGMLSTKIRTPRDEEINVPNAVVVGSSIKNYTRLNLEVGAPVSTTVTIGYSAPWRQIHAMLLDAAARTAGLRKEPAPRVLQTALSDFYVEYVLVARLEVAQARALVLSELHANIQDIFNVHGVQIMSPHYEGDPGEKVWVPKEKWYDAPAADSPGEGKASKGSSS